MGRPKLLSGCTVDGCNSPALSRGWCSKHYQKWYRLGDPLAGREKGRSIEDFWNNMDRTTGCWIWMGAINSNGYPQVWVEGRMHRAHRVAFERSGGVLVAGMDLDHLCHNEDMDCRGGTTCGHRSCCNPAHLEQVTREENLSRGRHHWDKQTRGKA